MNDKIIQWRKGESTIQQMVVKKLGIQMQKNEAGPSANTMYAKINLKWIKYLNLRHKTITLYKKTLGKIFITLDLGVICSL